MEKNDFLMAVETVGRNCAGFQTGGYIVTVAHKSLPSVFLAKVGSVAWIEHRYDEWRGKVTPAKLVVHDGKGEGRGGKNDVRDCGKKNGAWRVNKITLLTEDDPERFLFEKFAEEKTRIVSEPDFYPSNTNAFADSSMFVGYDRIEKKKAKILAETIALAITKAQEIIETIKKL